MKSANLTDLLIVILFCNLFFYISKWNFVTTEQIIDSIIGLKIYSFVGIFWYD